MRRVGSMAYEALGVAALLVARVLYDLAHRVLKPACEEEGRMHHEHYGADHLVPHARRHGAQ